MNIQTPMNLDHQVTGGDIHVITGQCVVTDGPGEHTPAVLVILRCLYQVAKKIFDDREVFRWSKVDRVPFAIDFNVVIRSRPLNAGPTICEPRVRRDPVSEGV